MSVIEDLSLSESKQGKGSSESNYSAISESALSADASEYQSVNSSTSSKLSTESEFTCEPRKEEICKKNPRNDDYRWPLALPDDSTVSPTTGQSMQTLREQLNLFGREQLCDLASFLMWSIPEANSIGAAMMDADPTTRRLMVRGLLFSTTNQTFAEYFSSYGELVNSAIIRHPDGRSQGYGFLIYKHRSAAEKALSRGHMLDGRVISVRLAAQGDEASRNKNIAGGPDVIDRKKLFIRNIRPDITREVLLEEFLVYGPIDECAVIPSAAGGSVSYGFVRYKQERDALRAAQLPYRMINDWVVFVSFSTGKYRSSPTTAESPAPPPPQPPMTRSGTIPFPPSPLPRTPAYIPLNPKHATTSNSYPTDIVHPMVKQSSEVAGFLRDSSRSHFVNNVEDNNEKRRILYRPENTSGVYGTKSQRIDSIVNNTVHREGRNVEMKKPLHHIGAAPHIRSDSPTLVPSNNVSRGYTNSNMQQFAAGSPEISHAQYNRGDSNWRSEKNTDAHPLAVWQKSCWGKLGLSNGDDLSDDLWSASTESSFNSLFSPFTPPLRSELDTPQSSSNSSPVMLAHSNTNSVTFPQGELPSLDFLLSG